MYNKIWEAIQKIILNKIIIMNKIIIYKHKILFNRIYYIKILLNRINNIKIIRKFNKNKEINNKKGMKSKFKIKIHKIVKIIILIVKYLFQIKTITYNKNSNKKIRMIIK